jgi:hypothetical protein
MEPTDVTIEILKDIRDSVRATNDRIDGLSDRMDHMSDRIVESELRTATAILDLRGTVVDLTTLLRSQFDLRPRVDRCEKDISDIKERLSLR